MVSFLSLQMAMIKETHRVVSLCCLTHIYTHWIVYIAHTQTYTHLFAWIINCERWQVASRWKERLFWTFVEPSKHYNLPFSFSCWTMRAVHSTKFTVSLKQRSRAASIFWGHKPPMLSDNDTLFFVALSFMTIWHYIIQRLQLLETQKGALHEIQ